jgi:hypothetical protein
MKVRTSLLAIAAVVILYGCSKPEDTVIPSDAKQWDTQLAPNVQKLSPEDKQLLTGYLMRAKMGEAFGGAQMPVGTTVAQGIDNQRQWLAQQEVQKAEQEKLRKEVEAKQAAAAAELQKSVVIAYLSSNVEPKNYQASRYSDTFLIDIGVKNNGDKAIKGIKAEAVFKNTFGEPIYTTRLNIEQSIASRSQVTWEGGHELNQFDDTDKKLINLQPGSFTVDTRAVMVVYDDGTTVGSAD